MDKKQLLEIFMRFMTESSGAWNAKTESDYVKNLAYRDGAVDFCSMLLEEMEKEQ